MAYQHAKVNAYWHQIPQNEKQQQQQTRRNGSGNN